MRGRLEFRVIDGDLGSIGRAMRRAFAPGIAEQRDDLYLLGPNPTRAWKLRGGDTLELKCLLAVEGPFQRWAPSGQVRLPATGACIVAAFARPGDLPPLPIGAMLDAAALTAAFARAGHVPRRLRKRRVRYDAVACLAEFVTLVADHGRRQSIAIEGEDRADLEDLRIRLGLQQRANTSLPDWLALPPVPELPPGPGDQALSSLAR